MTDDLGIHARIAGTVQIDGSGVARDVIVISDSADGRQVLANGSSNGVGAFDIDFHGYAGPVIALALDKYGSTFQPGTAYNIGQLVHPTVPNGYVFEVTVSGTTGTTEPEWNTSGSTVSGSVTFLSKLFYRPIASGPLLPEIMEDSDPPRPKLVYASPFVSAFQSGSSDTLFPKRHRFDYPDDCRVGDLLVVVGMSAGSKGSLTYPAGWVISTETPSGSRTHNAFVMWKFADGSEAGGYFDHNFVGDCLLSMCIFRAPDAYAISVSQNSVGRVTVLSGSHLTVTASSKSTLLCAAAKSFGYLIGGPDLRFITPGIPAAVLSYPHEWAKPFMAHYTGFTVEADSGQAFSIQMSTDYLSSTDEIAFVWLEMSTVAP